MKLKNIKAIETDMDGTIFLPEQVFSKEMIETFKQIKENNIIFIVNTGRGVSKGVDILKEADVLKYVDYVLGSNGIEVYDVKNNTVEVSAYLTPEIIKKLDAKYHNEDISLCVYEGCDIVTNKITPQYIERAKETNSKELVLDLENLKKYPKMLGIINPNNHQYFDNLFINDDSQDYEIHFSTAYLCEITPKGTSKYLGTKNLFEKLGIKENEVITFGDGENDINMMKGEKIKVAMGHAPEKLKEVCDYITSDIYHNGVKEFLDNYLF